MQYQRYQEMQFCIQLYIDNLGKVLTKKRNDLKQPETTYNKQEKTWNDLQRTRNNLKQPKTSSKWIKMTHDKYGTTYNNLNLPTMNKRRPKMTNNKEILRLFYNKV